MADVMYLFMEDICGEKKTASRHVKTYCNVYKMCEKIKQEYIRALKAFQEDAMYGRFLEDAQTVRMDPAELASFENVL